MPRLEVGKGWVNDDGTPYTGSPGSLQSTKKKVTYGVSQGKAPDTAPAPNSGPPPSAGLAKPDSQQQEREEMEGLLPKYTKAGNTYYDKTEGATNQWFDNYSSGEKDYKTGLQGLMSESEDMGRLADKTYGEVSGNLKSMMDASAIDAGNAMTLAESMDPNNKVAAGFRGFYEDQAQGARNRGLADVGVMQSLGAQAFGNQMGAYGPMTGGQMSALMGQNQSQAGMAMANVQRRVQNLRDQGIEEGWNQTNMAYDRGQGAKDRYTNDTLNYEGAGNRYQGLKGGLREERAGYGENILGSDTRVADAQRGSLQDLATLRYGLDTGDYDKQAAIISDTWGNRQAERIAEKEAEAARYAAEQSKKGSIWGSLITAGGTAAGGYFGGPAGAAAGGAAGSAASNAIP